MLVLMLRLRRYSLLGETVIEDEWRDSEVADDFALLGLAIGLMTES